jgi:hypothetical protein
VGGKGIGGWGMLWGGIGWGLENDLDQTSFDTVVYNRFFRGCNKPNTLSKSSVLPLSSESVRSQRTAFVVKPIGSRTSAASASARTNEIT